MEQNIINDLLTKKISLKDVELKSLQLLSVIHPYSYNIYFFLVKKRYAESLNYDKELAKLAMLSPDPHFTKLALSHSDKIDFQFNEEYKNVGFIEGVEQLSSWTESDTLEEDIIEQQGAIEEALKEDIAIEEQAKELVTDNQQEEDIEEEEVEIDHPLEYEEVIKEEIEQEDIDLDLVDENTQALNDVQEEISLKDLNQKEETIEDTLVGLVKGEQKELSKNEMKWAAFLGFSNDKEKNTREEISDKTAIEHSEEEKTEIEESNTTETVEKNEKEGLVVNEDVEVYDKIVENELKSDEDQEEIEKLVEADNSLGDEELEAMEVNLGEAIEQDLKDSDEIVDIDEEAFLIDTEDETDAVDEQIEIISTIADEEENAKYLDEEVETDALDEQIEIISSIDEGEVIDLDKEEEIDLAGIENKDVEDLSFSEWLLSLDGKRSKLGKEENDDEEEIAEAPIKKGKSLQPMSEIEIKANQFNKRNTKIASETLAKLMVNQGEIEEAIKIYNQLKLQYPDKSGYFASQINKLK